MKFNATTYIEGATLNLWDEGANTYEIADALGLDLHEVRSIVRAAKLAGDPRAPTRRFESSATQRG